MVSPIRQLLDQSLQKIRDESEQSIRPQAGDRDWQVAKNTPGSHGRGHRTVKILSDIRDTSYNDSTRGETSYDTSEENTTSPDTSYETSERNTSYETSYYTRSSYAAKTTPKPPSPTRQRSKAKNQYVSKPKQGQYIRRNLADEEPRRPFESDIYPASASSIMAADPYFYRTISPKPSDVSSSVATQIVPDVLVVSKDKHEFHHSSLLLSYVAPVFAEHWKPMQHGEFRLDLPNTSKEEWTRLQGFLEPPSKHLPVTVDVRYLSQTLPWFQVLQFDHLLDYVDKMLLSLIHGVLHDSPLCLKILQLTHFVPELKSTHELALRRSEQVLLSATDISEQDLRQFIHLLQDNARIRSSLWRSVVVGLPSDIEGNPEELVYNPLFFYLYRQGLETHKDAMKDEGISFRSNPMTWAEWLESEDVFEFNLSCGEWLESLLLQVQLPRLLLRTEYDSSSRTFSC